ncbi:MAG TPA: DALR anticodon-binding domain-containing protein, partial [Burkholderiales bacterium]|nr:DALR anticodon-binding domain-containing protein [Burkholderiales bacterium]
NFIRERLSGLLKDQGYSPQEIDSVLALEPQVLSDIPERLEAVRAFMKLPEAGSLAAANKRVSNILKKSEEALQEFDPELLKEQAEKNLHAKIESVMPVAEQRFREGDYVASLMILAELREPVDSFFDEVMVNVEESAIRINRLALLGLLRDGMNRVADISRLAS